VPQFFIKSANISGSRCLIGGSDYRHLTRVRRVKAGDILNLRTEEGLLAKAEIIIVTDSIIEAEIIEEAPARPMPLRLCLCVSLLKGKKMDFVIQKCVEIGVDRIVPFISERSIPRPEDKGGVRVQRWNRIAKEAAKQSMRLSVPSVAEIHRFSDVAAMKFDGDRIIAHPGTGGSGFDVKKNDAALMIGPEGGFSEREMGEACEAGWKPCSFGFSELRSETAAIVLPAVMIHEWTKKP